MFTRITVVGIAVDELERLADRFDCAAADIIEAIHPVRIPAGKGRSERSAPEYVIVNAADVERARARAEKEAPLLAAALGEVRRQMLRAGVGDVVAPFPSVMAVPGVRNKRALAQAQFTKAAIELAPVEPARPEGYGRVQAWLADRECFEREVDACMDWAAPRAERLARLVSRAAVVVGFACAKDALLDPGINGKVVQRLWAELVFSAAFAVAQSRAVAVGPANLVICAAVAHAVAQALDSTAQITSGAALVVQEYGIQGAKRSGFRIGGHEEEVRDVDIDAAIAECMQAELSEARERMEVERLGMPWTKPGLTPAMQSIFGSVEADADEAEPT